MKSSTNISGHLGLWILAVTISMTSTFDFQDGAGNVKWAMGCDFYGSDIGSVPGPGEQCGGNCVSNSQCTHFTWYNNVCYLKRFGNSPTATNLNGGVCGWVNRVGPPPVGSGRLFVVNNCPNTVWLATSPNNNISPLPVGTIQLTKGQSYSYNIPSGGWAGRFWPKIGCDSSGNNCVFGQSSPPCPTGGCHPPADTKIEFNFAGQGSKQQTWYDISLVDGYSLPIKIVPRGINQGSCIPTTCSVSLNACPSNENNGLGDLRVWKNGNVVACLAPCKKWNFPAPYGFNKPELQSPGVNMCCPTPPISVEQCRTGPVVSTSYVKLIRSVCPTAYSYAYDDEGGLHACPETTNFDVTICP